MIDVDYKSVRELEIELKDYGLALAGVVEMYRFYEIRVGGNLSGLYEDVPVTILPPEDGAATGDDSSMELQRKRLSRRVAEEVDSEQGKRKITPEKILTEIFRRRVALHMKNGRVIEGPVFSGSGHPAHLKRPNRHKRFEDVVVKRDLL